MARGKLPVALGVDKASPERNRGTVRLQCLRPDAGGRRSGRRSACVKEGRGTRWACHAARDGRHTQWTSWHAGDAGTAVLAGKRKPRQPVPAFLGLNFKGNHSTTLEPDVGIHHNEFFGGDSRDASYPFATAWTDTGPAERGVDHARWPYSLIVQRGYAVATVHYEELEIDFPGAAALGVRGLFAGAEDLNSNPDPFGWGAIGAWAWGLSRTMDVLEGLDEIDSSKVIVVGHSRLGKTALWAAAQEPRFAAAVSNNSGCGGASLFRHKSGEDIALITGVRPHWFAARLAEYGDREDELPVDQHQLLALIAPRPVHVASATVDPGADPYGEYLSTLYASPVFELFGLTGVLPVGLVCPGHDLPVVTAHQLPPPSPGVRVGGALSYHIRAGEHDMVAEDWTHALEFADRTVHIGSATRRQSDGD